MADSGGGEWWYIKLSGGFQLKANLGEKFSYRGHPLVVGNRLPVASLIGPKILCTVVDLIAVNSVVKNCFWLSIASVFMC